MIKYVQYSALSIIFFLIFLFTTITDVKSQCSGGGLLGAVTPTTAWQTTCIQGGQYVTFSATINRVYTFSFCQGGGSNPNWDTQITILDNSGNIVSNGYNDDYCGTGSHIQFVAPSTATYRVLIAKYNCTADAICQTMAYTISPPINDNICSATYIYGNSCTCTYTTSTTFAATNSPQANPGCGGYNGRDVWFSTKAPSSGQMLLSSQAGTITDGAMAVYRGSSCTGALTLLACNDDVLGTMPQISLAGLTPGDSLFIRFWSYNNSEVGSFGICITDPAPYYCMAGNASEMNPGKCIQVTPNKRAQQSCIWNTTQINMSSTFDYSYTVNLGNNDAGADGLTFTLQNNPAGLSACGDPGVALGIGPVTNTFIVEFDTYNNGVVAADVPEDHTAISINGNLAAPVAGPVQASATSVNIEDGLDHTVRIVWNPATTVFEVYFDGVLRLSYTDDIINTVFGGNPNVYWGFTGSTGLFTNTQYLCPGNLPGVPPTLPVTWGAFDAELMDEKTFVTWTTLSERDNKEFIVERSQDGSKYEAIGSVKGLGNSSIAAKYQFIDPSPLSGISYYRINQIDYNGASSYSQAKSINYTKTKSHAGNFCKIFPNPASSHGTITAQLEEDATVELYDNLGNSILKDALVKGPNVLTVLEGLEAGMYHFVLKSNTSVQFITLVVAGR